MLALHAVWSTGEPAGLVVWSEDGELPLPAARQDRRRAASHRPCPHPFAASRGRLAGSLASCGSPVASRAACSAVRADAVLWLPGRPGAPDASPELLRAGDARVARGGPRTPGPALHPYVVPALCLAHGAALDFLVTAGRLATPGLRVGPSVTALAAVAELALEIVAGGRFLPDLVADGSGGHLARWARVGADTGADAERLALLAAGLPPSCRALAALCPHRGPGSAPAPDAVATAPPDVSPATLLDDALGAFVDVLCREGAREPMSSPGRARRAGRGAPSRHMTVAAGPPPGDGAAAGRWLQALGDASPAVQAGPGGLAKLERLVAEWRAAVTGGAGPWRLCFRLREPGDEPADRESSSGADHPSAEPSGAADPGPWRVELLLQATEDLSLLVGAAEVWRAGDDLRRVTHTFADPQEVFLAELGRAVRAYPDLSTALREPLPTGLQTDVAGAHRFLTDVAPALEIAGFGVLLPAWWRRPSGRLGLRLRSATASSATASAATVSGVLDRHGLAAFHWKAALGEQEIELTELQALAELKAPLVRVRGQWAELRPDEVAELVAFLGDPGGSSTLMTVADVLRVAAGVAPSEAGVPVVGVEAGGVIGAMLSGELDAVLDVRGTPPGFRGELRPYQARGVAWIQLLERLGLGACLADDMGLGKTATVLAVIQATRTTRTTPPCTAPIGARSRTERAPGEPAVPSAPSSAPCAPPSTAGGGPTLVVCPTSVVGNWQHEAARFTPDLAVVVHHGATRARGDRVRREVEGADVVVTSYPIVERDRAVLASVPWGRIVLDEAQHVKNPSAGQTWAVRSLKAPRRLALTGTPVENHLGDLWSIMDILNPGLLGPEAAFREQFAVPIERFHEEDATGRLRTVMRPFVLRRLKTDRAVVADLPEKLELKVVCSLTREQGSLYQAVVDQMLRQIDEADGVERRGLVLATVLRLKQVCNHPAQYLGDGSALAGRSGKLERTVEILEEVLEAGEKALVFTQFAEMGRLLCTHLRQRLGCRVAFLWGGTARARRDEMVAELQSPEGGVPVMVLSLRAGGTGLNLMAANHVLHFDRWWNPAVESQATDRAYRIGQRRDVQVRTLVCAGTVEDRVDWLIDAKRHLADRVVGPGEAWLAELSTEELARVLRLSGEMATT